MQLEYVQEKEKKPVKRRIKRASKSTTSARKKPASTKEDITNAPIPPTIYYRKHHYLGKQFTEVKKLSPRSDSDNSTILTKSEIKFVMGSFNSIYQVGNAMVNVLDQTYTCGNWNILKQNSTNKKCNCTRSMCENSYCQCVKAGKICGQDCYCKGCKNKVRRNLTQYFESLTQRYMTEKEKINIGEQQSNNYQPNKTTRESKSPTTLSSSPRMVHSPQQEHSPQQPHSPVTTQCSLQPLTSHIATCNCTQRQCLSNYCTCHRKGINCSSRCGCRSCRN